jgi:hypothetical protein
LTGELHYLVNKRMYFPQTEDYIDIHVHNGRPASGIFIVESLMAHEEKLPVDISGSCFTLMEYIHGSLMKTNHKHLINFC